MVGNPSAHLVTASIITTYLIPVKIVLSTGQSFEPVRGLGLQSRGQTMPSPIFDNTTDYVQGGVDVGATQYVDAYQRGNFWSIRIRNPNYHVIWVALRQIQLPELTLNVPAGCGHIGHPFGLPGRRSRHQLLRQPDQHTTWRSTPKSIQHLPIFETDNTYLTEGGCCIGGYHSANGQQTYGTSLPTSLRRFLAGRFRFVARSRRVDGRSVDQRWQRHALRNPGKWRSAGRRQLRSSRTAPGSTRCTTSPTTCRTWCSCGTSVRRSRHLRQQLVELPELPVHHDLPERLLVRSPVQ